MQFCLAFILAELLTLHIDCGISGALIRSFSDGGIVGGDPAPGRSPGPPTLQGTSEEYPSVLLTAAENFKDCSFSTNILTATKHFIDVDITHHLFNTDVLVPNILYEGKNYNIEFILN